MNCKYCGLEVEQVSGKRSKEYCNDAHRQAYWRQQHLNGANNAEVVEQIAYRDKRIEEQAQQIAELQKILDKERKDRNSYQDQASACAETWMHENRKLKTELEEREKELMRLKHLLDVDRWYRMDSTRRTFKAWLKKQPSTPVSQKILENPDIPYQGSRAQYEAYLRRYEYSADELEEFAHLWKTLLQSL